MTAKESRFDDRSWVEALERAEAERLLARFAAHQKGMEQLRRAARDEAPLFPGSHEGSE